ncbi:hypothetical protein MTR67_028955 [Solanum verrucosum]|uniref:Uncharacterized protein n=1 Tax=Solanum verrucosum TaxID=315347 RepID=A0AAF0R733_SOLVR|nr:hypothetical protein MTR67_028955 [Solanum verrucosum]
MKPDSYIQEDSGSSALLSPFQDRLLNWPPKFSIESSCNVYNVHALTSTPEIVFISLIRDVQGNLPQTDALRKPMFVSHLFCRERSSEKLQKRRKNNATFSIFLQFIKSIIINKV